MELLFVHFYCGAYDSQSTTKIAMDVLHPTSPHFTATEIPFETSCLVLPQDYLFWCCWGAGVLALLQPHLSGLAHEPGPCFWPLETADPVVPSRSQERSRIVRSSLSQ